VLNYYLATSRDAETWDLTAIYSGRSLVERGGEGAWDKDMIIPANWIVTHSDRHWVYYGGYNERHGTAGVYQPKRESAIGLATLRLDGFVSLTADDAAGTVLTQPFTLTGDALQVNADANRGEIAIDVLDPTGEPLAEYSGDQAAAHQNVDDVRLPARWPKPLSQLKGKTIQLRFRLRNASLYAFQVV
jgi:hypothetical protein